MVASAACAAAAKAVFRRPSSFMASGETAAAVIAAGVHARAVGVGRAVADDHGDDDDDGAENDVSDS